MSVNLIEMGKQAKQAAFPTFSTGKKSSLDNHCRVIGVGTGAYFSRQRAGY